MTNRFTDLVSMLQTSVEKYQNKPLFGVKRDGVWRWTTYNEFGELVDRLRSALYRLGVRPGDRVAVIANNQLPWAVACYATYGLGAAYVPMYESQLDKDLSYILADSGAKVCLVANRKILDRVKAFQSKTPELKELVSFDDSAGKNSYAELLKGEPDHEAVTPGVNDIANLTYTSGTTGNPKGVALTHKNLAANLNGVSQIVPFKDNDRTLAFLPWAHVYGGSIEMHSVVSTGSSTGICEDRTKIVEFLGEVKPTLLFAVPEIWKRIYEGVARNIASQPKVIQQLFHAGVAGRRKQLKQQPLTLIDRAAIVLAERLVFAKIRARFGGRLQYAVSGAAALPAEVGEFVAALGITVYEGYGMTECAGVATSNCPGHVRLGTVGQALPGMQIKIDFTAAGSDEQNGEIVLYGDSVMSGYYHQPEETAAAMTPDGGLRTGDLGRIDADGYVTIAGRVKELYKLENGKYVAPAPLEEILAMSPYISQIMVYGHNRPFNVAVIVPNQETLNALPDGGGRLDQAGLQKLLDAEIAKHSAGIKGYERVKKFVVAKEPFTTDNDMLTPSLKIKRRNVLKAYSDAIDGLYK